MPRFPKLGMLNIVEDTTPQLGGILDTNSKQILLSKGADIASAGALTLGTDGNYFDVTGVTTITSIGALGVGTSVILHFDSILTLTHHATDLILPSGANITTAAGDEAIFVEYATGDWRCIAYTKANGEAIVGSGAVVASGSYTGDSTVNRAIAHGLGVTPKFIFIIRAANPVIYVISHPGEIHHSAQSVATVHAVTAQDATNFYVGNSTSYSQSANSTGAAMKWVAIG